VRGRVFCWAKGLNRKRTAYLWCKTKEHKRCKMFKEGREKMLAGMMSVSSELMRKVIPKKFRVVFRVEKIIEARDEDEASEIFFARLSEEPLYSLFLADADYTVLDLDIEEFDERVENTKSLQEFEEGNDI